MNTVRVAREYVVTNPLARKKEPLLSLREVLVYKIKRKTKQTRRVCFALLRHSISFVIWE